MGRLGFAGSLYLGSWHADVMEHDGARGKVLPATAAEREEWGRQGAVQVRAIVEKNAPAGGDDRAAGA